MSNISNINIDNISLVLMKDILENKITEDKIIALVNNLRLSNKMDILSTSQFDFETDYNNAGSWDQDKNKFKLSYKRLQPSVIISTILHEFRHSWQYQNKDNLNELMQSNLIGVFGSNNELYYSQPIENDAFKFEYNAMIFLAKELNKYELKLLADTTYNNYKQNKQLEINEFKKFKYNIDNVFLNKMFSFRANRLQNDEENPNLAFDFEHYKIVFTINNNNLYYVIYDKNSFDKYYDDIEYTALSASCVDDKCKINDFILFENNLNFNIFNELLSVNEEIINYSNKYLNKDIKTIEFTPHFVGMNKKQHNLLISKSHYNTKLIHIGDPYFENPFNIEIKETSKLEEYFNKTLKDFSLKQIINKINDNKVLSDDDIKLLKERFKNINLTIGNKTYKLIDLPDENIIKLFKQQIEHNNSYENILNDKKVLDAYSNFIKFNNSESLETKIKYNTKSQKDNIKNKLLDDIVK